MGYAVYSLISAVRKVEEVVAVAVWQELVILVCGVCSLD